MVEWISKIQVAILGVVLGVCLIVSAVLISNNVSKNEIAVTGTANETVKSDNAKWSFSVKAVAPTRLESYKKLEDTVPKVKKFLTDNNIKEENIDLGQMNSYFEYKINPVTGRTTQEINTYTYEQTFDIKSEDVELVKKLQLESQSLIEQGIEIGYSGVDYYYSKLAEKKAELLSAATLDAKNRAAGMLKATNNRVGKMRSVRMGVFQITRPESNDVSDWGINDTSTIEKKVTAVANVVFAIK